MIEFLLIGSGLSFMAAGTLLARSLLRYADQR